MDREVTLNNFDITIDTYAREYEIEKYWNAVKNYNPSNNKPYHNLWHTICVVKYCYLIGKDEDIDDNSMMFLLLAAMFHDFGHFSKDDSKNVERAKQAFSDFAYMIEGEHFNASFVQTMVIAVHKIIDATKYPYDIPDSELSLYQKIIRDADLLQWTEPTMIEHVFKGLAEEMEIPLHIFLPKNKAFIEGNLPTYRTNWARKHAKKEFPKQWEKLEVFEKMVKQIGHRRIILVAKAASGKDFLRNRLTARNLKPSISITTRPPRPGEVEGKDYFFITESKAEQMIENDEFYEYVRFNNWLYGTTKKQFMEDDVFIMTPAGVSKIHQEDRKSCFIIYLDIPEDTRKLRLLQRQMPGDTVDRRIAADEEDFRNFKDYDMRVTNPDF